MLSVRRTREVKRGLLTGDATQQAQGGRVPSEAGEDRVLVALGHRDGHRDGFVELPPAGFQSDDGTEGGLVAQDLPDHIHAHRLSLWKHHLHSL